MKHGDLVSRYEAVFAERVGAKYAIATSNGTVSLEVALRAMEVGPGDRVATTPLTMAATSIAILNVGATPVYCDVRPDTWLMRLDYEKETRVNLPVSLYGLHMNWCGSADIDDAAQTFRPHSAAAFTSYSTQQSKIISTGEGGMLVTNHRELATRARSVGSLGYDMQPEQARISSDALKRPDYNRHVRYPAMNARCNDVTASRGLLRLTAADKLLDDRQEAAAMYRDAIEGCAWMQPQSVSLGCTHDYWAYAVACDTPARALWLADAVVRHGGERPYPAWQLTFREPAFRHLDPSPYEAPQIGRKEPPPMEQTVACPNARSLQPRILQFQTNHLASAETNARALRLAIQEATP